MNIVWLLVSQTNLCPIIGQVCSGTGLSIFIGFLCVRSLESNSDQPIKEEEQKQDQPLRLSDFQSLVVKRRGTRHIYLVIWSTQDCGIAIRLVSKWTLRSTSRKEKWNNYRFGKSLLGTLHIYLDSWSTLDCGLNPTRLWSQWALRNSSRQEKGNIYRFGKDFVRVLSFREQRC